MKSREQCDHSAGRDLSLVTGGIVAWYYAQNPGSHIGSGVGVYNVYRVEARIGSLEMLPGGRGVHTFRCKRVQSGTLTPAELERLERELNG